LEKKLKEKGKIEKEGPPVVESEYETVYETDYKDEFDEIDIEVKKSIFN
jgi:hypothetical protein